MLHINRYALTTIAISIACLAPACGGEVDPLEETLASERQAVEAALTAETAVKNALAERPSMRDNVFPSTEFESAAPVVPVTSLDPLIVKDIETGATLRLSLPADKEVLASEVGEGLFVYADAEQVVDHALQIHVDGGFQAMVVIKDSSAPDTYAYPLDLPDGASAELQDDGSIDIVSTEGELIGRFNAPWAKDALGRPVPTFYTLEDGAIVQHVDLSQVSAFPVVADPDGWIGWARCGTAIALFAAENATVFGKLRKLGGAKKYVKALKRLKNKAERKMVLYKLAGDITGLDRLSACL